MKLLIIFLAILATGLAKSEYHPPISMQDYGFREVIFNPTPNHVFIYTIKITKNGIQESSISYALSDSAQSDVSFQTASPSWAHGPIFKLPEVWLEFKYYTVVSCEFKKNLNDGDTFCYKLLNDKNDKVEIDITFREVPYGKAKSDFPQIPEAPKAHGGCAAWRIRIVNENGG